MTHTYQNKYRISLARLPTWDYNWPAAYFVTICTAIRIDFFGNISNSELRLSKIGKITESEWVNTPRIRPDMNLKLGAFVVMPNHLHGIIIIGNNEYNGAGRDAMHRVSTGAQKPIWPPTQKSGVNYPRDQIVCNQTGASI